MSTCQWTRGQAIGRGSSATVSVTTDSRTGSIFAVKSAELALSRLLQREAGILSKLDCPRVVKYLGHDVSAENGRNFYNLFLEYVEGGTLSDAIQLSGGQLEAGSIQKYTRAIVEGLLYLHSRGIAHCDINGHNLLIGSDGAKIADLGCARWVEGDSGIAKRPIAGTPLFMAPEVVRGKAQGFAADVWALGCTVIEMATGGAPWPDVDDAVAALYRIGYSTEVPEFPSGLSDKANDFLSKRLRRSPKERWTANQLLKHPFVGESNSLTKSVLGSVSLTSSKSTLDQCFWESADDVRTQLELTHVEPADGSLVARLRRLSCGNTPSGMADWSWEENWVTVRSSDAVGVQSVAEQEDRFPVDEGTSGLHPVLGDHESQDLSTSRSIEENKISIQGSKMLYSNGEISADKCIFLVGDDSFSNSTFKKQKRISDFCNSIFSCHRKFHRFSFWNHSKNHKFMILVNLFGVY